jgi:hypothetical protein
MGQKLWQLTQYAWISRSSSSSLSKAARENACWDCDRLHRGQVATKRINSLCGSAG